MTTLTAATIKAMNAPALAPSRPIVATRNKGRFRAKAIPAGIIPINAAELMTIVDQSSNSSAQVWMSA